MHTKLHNIEVQEPSKSLCIIRNLANASLEHQTTTHTPPSLLEKFEIAPIKGETCFFHSKKLRLQEGERRKLDAKVLQFSAKHSLICYPDDIIFAAAEIARESLL